MPPTVGEIVERFGPLNLMVAVSELATARGRIPVGWWVVSLGDGFELTVNGTASKREMVEPWCCAITRYGFPVAYFNAAEGEIYGNHTEAQLLMRLTAARMELIG